MKGQGLRSKFLGSMIGCAVGDALGSLLEGSWYVQTAKIRTLVQRQKNLRYTDDTHMMIGVAESLIEKGGFDANHMAETFLRNYEREPFRGYGSGPPHVFRQMRKGVPWRRASESLYAGGSYGNGSAMRVAPIGLFYHDDFVKLKDVASESSYITHAHILAREGAALQAGAVAQVVSLDPATRFETKDFLCELSGLVQHEIYRRKLNRIKQLLPRTNKSTVKSELGNGIEAFNSVPTAIFCFLSHPESFQESIIYAISLAGDTDTIAAMTGAISGAYHGIQSIEESWKTKLENRDYVEELAEDLWSLKTQDLREGHIRK